MSKEKKFEENLADLEAIVQKLESGDVALEEAKVINKWKDI